MEFKFVSNKPWVDETIRLRKALFFTTLLMSILGIILAIIGIVLLAYMEFVVGVIAIIFGILLPVAYFWANIFMLSKRRKDYDKGMVIEYHFTDDALEIIKVSDTYKSKDVVDYCNLSVNKVFEKSRFIVLKTKSYYADYIVLRKSDIRLDEGEEKSSAIVSFISFLMAKVAEANKVEDTTCSVEGEEIMSADDEFDDIEKVDEKVEENEISGLNNENEQQNDTTIDDEETPSVEDDVIFDDFTEQDDVVDIMDENNGEDVEVPHSEYEVVEEDVKTDSEQNSDDLFDYSERLVDGEEYKSNDVDTEKLENNDDDFLYDYSYDNDKKEQ